MFDNAPRIAYTGGTMGKKDKPDVEILYQDEHVVAVSKPAGLTVVPLRTGEEECVKSVLAARLGREVFAVHRLDRETSGVVVFALDAESHRTLSLQFQNRKVEKVYWAVVHGRPNPPEGAVRLPLARDRNPIRVVIVRKGGKRSRTDYRMLQEFRGYSLVEARPLTGRMHQVRVHLAAIGCPLAVDPLYGGSEALLLSQIKSNYKHKEGQEERPLISRLTLHAYELTVTHPVTQARLSVRAPLPHDFALVLKQLAKHAPSTNTRRTGAGGPGAAATPRDDMQKAPPGDGASLDAHHATGAVQATPAPDET